MRSMALTAVLAAVLVSAPLGLAFAGGRDHDHGHDHGHHDRDRERPSHATNERNISQSKGITDGDNTNSSAPISGRPLPPCVPGQLLWSCSPYYQ